MRQTRADSTRAAVQAAEDAAQPPIEPPRHVKIPAKVRPYWLAVVRSRARHKWTDADLVSAGTLARAMADVERLQREIEKEGEVIGEKLNPKCLLLDRLTRRVMSLSRLLHVHPSATAGRAQDQGNKLALQREAEAVADPLIPTLRRVG